MFRRFLVSEVVDALSDIIKYSSENGNAAQAPNHTISSLNTDLNEDEYFGVESKPSTQGKSTIQTASSLQSEYLPEMAASMKLGGFKNAASLKAHLAIKDYQEVEDKHVGKSAALASSQHSMIKGGYIYLHQANQ